MTTEKMTVPELLKVGDEEFDNAIKDMSVKELMETISGVQKEMAKEQENFNSLSGELQNRKERNSRQYRQISKDMMTSQQRLTLLMNRSMKCFSQQNVHHSSNNSPLKRRNSAKGPHPAVESTSKTPSIYRSKSMHAVNQPTDSAPNSPIEQSSANPNAASSYGMDKSHKPIIMKTAVNGNNNNNNNNRFIRTTTFNNVMTKNTGSGSNDSRVAHSSLGAGNVKAGGLQSSTVEAKVGKEDNSVGDGSMKKSAVLAPSTDSGNVSNSAIGTSGSSSSGGGGGLYVKRKPAQQQRVTTTATINSSRLLPTGEQHSLTIASSSSSFTASTPTLTSLGTGSQSSNLPSRPPASSSNVFSNETRFLKSKPSASYAAMQSPLQMAQARKGVSKSQILTQEPESGSAQFRGLPNVRLLAQTFGSSTTLNLTPAPSMTGARLGGSQSNLYTGTRVNSHSSTALNDDPAPAPIVSNRIFITKGSIMGAPVQQQQQLQQQQQQEPAALSNGKPQQTQLKQLKRVPVSAPPAQVSTGNSELELARSRLKTNRNVRETTEATTDNSNSEIVAHDTFVSVVPKSSEDEAKEKRVMENMRVGAYVKKKDAPPNRPATNTLPPPSSSSVTIRSTSSASTATTGDRTSSSPLSSSLSISPPSQDAALNKPAVASAPASKPATRFQTSSSTSMSNSAFPKPQTQTGKFHVANASLNFASLPPQQTSSNTSGRIVSTAAVTIRRAKSRDELQQVENQTLSNKDTLLKQIQARRRYDDDEVDGGGSNMKAMSKLSFSMPSLLLEGKERHSRQTF